MKHLVAVMLGAAAAIKYPPDWCKDVSSPEGCAKLVQDGSCAKSKTRQMCPLSCGLEDPSKSYTCTVDVANESASTSATRSRARNT